MAKVDYKKGFKALYKPSAKQPVLVEVPAMNYLMIDGQSDPNTSPAYQTAVEALFGVSYALKFMIKKGETAVEPLAALAGRDKQRAVLAIPHTAR